MTEDDDYLPPHDHYYERSQQQRYRRPLGSTRDYPHGDSRTSTSAYFNSQNFSILMAIFVIFAIRKGGFGIRRFFAERRNEGLLNTLMDLILEVQEYAVAYGQMAFEFGRKLRGYLLAHGDEWYHHDNHTMTLPSPNPAAALLAMGPRGRRRAAPVANRLVSSRMPELEETDVQKQQLDESQLPQDQQHHQLEDKENTDPLEPAFLRDEDYPPGWLVFDPVLGVVTKTEADNYRRKQNQEHWLPGRPAKPSSSPRQQPQPRAQSPNLREANKKEMQPKSPSQQYNSKNTNTPTRPLRTNNGMSSASAMHTPQTIAANG